MDHSISDDEIYKYLTRDKCKIVKYSQLSDIDNLENFLSDKLFLVILYEWKENYGHWTCIIKNDFTNTFEFFDSYGTKPDKQLFELDLRIRNNFGLDFPKVAILLYESNRTIIYNNFKLQSTKEGINTCGKWVIIRCCMYITPIETFAKIFTIQKNHDKYLQSIWLNFIKNYKKF